jgi:hypothetical protein
MSAGRHLGDSLALKIALGLAQKQLMDTHRYETARPVPDEVFDRLRITPHAFRTILARALREPTLSGVAFASDPEARRLWMDITPVARWDWIRWRNQKS